MVVLSKRGERCDKEQWLVLCANVTGLRVAQKTGKTSFLDVPMRMFPEEISILISRLRKDHFHLCGWT
jgi:hypothetical protein